MGFSKKLGLLELKVAMLNTLSDDRKFLTLTLALPLLLFSVNFLLSYYSFKHTTFPRTNLTETEDSQSQTEMEIVTSSYGTRAPILTGEMIFGGVKIERNPSESRLIQLGVSSWPKWECGPSKFPWTFSATETMYLQEGKVEVYCEGYDGFFKIGAGDLVQFPKGMNVTWDVIEGVSKHYNLKK